MKFLLLLYAVGLHYVNAYFQGPLSFAMNVLAAFVIPGYVVIYRYVRTPRWSELCVYFFLVSVSITYGLACVANFVAAITGQKLSGAYAELLTQAVLVALVFLPSKTTPKLRDLVLPAFELKKTLYVLGLALIPLAAVASAMRLNQADDSRWSIALVCVIVLLALVQLVRSRLWFPQTTIYSMSLALLLLGSVRGDFLSGTDMSTELFLANLVGENGYWIPSLSPDAYNSALSVTALPNYLGNLFDMDNAAVFRFLIPMLYALVPVVIFSFFERHRSKVFGVVGALLYISQPAFVVWSPVPARQMVAILFFVAMLYVGFDVRVEKLHRDLLFFVFGALMILSHYSTSYVSLPVLFLGTVITLMLRLRWLYWSGQPRKLPFEKGVFVQFRRLRSNFRMVDLEAVPQISIRLLAGLFVFAFIWFGPVTHVGDNLARTIERSASEITSGQWNLLGTSGYASGTSLAYQLGLSQDGRDTESVFRDYRFEVFEIVEANNLDVIEPQTWRNTPRAYPSTQSAIDSTPMEDLIAGSERVLRNLLRLFLVAGFLMLVIAMFRRRLDTIGAYALAACLALAMVVIVPGASIQYDVGRTTQQMLPLLGFAIISAASAAAAGLTRHRLKTESSPLVLGFLLVFLLMSSSGLVNKITGVTNPSMMLSNSGEMYEQIYVHSEELAAVRWLESHQEPNSLVQSGYFGGTRLPLVGIERPGMRHVFSWSIDKSAYLFRGNQELDKGMALTYFSGQYLRYKYPSAEIERYKNIVYTNGHSEIYR